MFILASKPPRRADLLRQIGAKFTVEESNAREFTGAKADKSPAEIALANAKLKALDVSEKAKDKNLPVLGADTVVVLDEVIYGKPKDHEDAKEMLRKLSGKTHEVITGMVLVTKGKSYPAAETTRVHLAAYVATGEPMDKAGAYALQGRAAAFIEGIEGSYSNVVGLPLHLFTVLAKKAEVDIYK